MHEHEFQYSYLHAYYAATMLVLSNANMESPTHR
jgi:hypothetical protein